MKATAPFDPFRNYPEFNLSDLPADMPPEYKTRMRSLLPYVDLNPVVEGLVYTTRDASGTLVSSVPVQNRPWEWTEYLGDPIVTDDRSGDTSGTLKNSASLSLELFGAHPTGENVIALDAAKGDARAYSEIRALQDDQHGESIFKRDWRETRVDPDLALSGPPKDAAQTQGVAGPSQIHQQQSSDGRQSSTQSSRMASPSASSVRSRGSVQPSGMSFISSPAGQSFARLTGSSAADPIDVDSLDIPMSTGTGKSKGKGKRKMADIVEDDELELIEDPVPVTKADKKSKGKTAAKTRAKKR